MILEDIDCGRLDVYVIWDRGGGGSFGVAGNSFSLILHISIETHTETLSEMLSHFAIELVFKECLIHFNLRLLMST